MSWLCGNSSLLLSSVQGTIFYLLATPLLNTYQGNLLSTFVRVQLLQNSTAYDMYIYYFKLNQNKIIHYFIFIYNGDKMQMAEPGNLHLSQGV